MLNVLNIYVVDGALKVEIIKKIILLFFDSVFSLSFVTNVEYN